MGENFSEISVRDPQHKPVRLTLKQRLFIDFYLGKANFNASEAARLAGYAIEYARMSAYKNLQKPHIAREIERRLDLMGLTEGEIQSRLGQMARGEIATKTVTKGDEITEIYDKRQALEDAARLKGLLVDKHQVQAIQGLLIEDGD